MLRNKIEPIPVFDGEVSVHAFGREHGVNFSFKGIDESSDAFHTHAAIFQALASIRSKCDYFAPSPALMNAEIVKPSSVCCKKWEFMREDPLGRTILHRGNQADGLFVYNGQSYVMSAADCALVVVKNGDHIIAAHAGRNSIIDMKAMKGNRARENESIVHSIRTAIEGAGAAFCDTNVWIGLSISPGDHFAHAFDDPRNPHNKTMVEYISREYGASCFKDDGYADRRLGYLDMKELIARQFIKLGVPEKNIAADKVCTFSEKRDGEYVWYSNVRDGGKRNLMAVVKNS